MSCINPIFDPDQCWICLSTNIESNEELIKMGCLCNRKCHESCAREWYSKKIRLHNSIQICETCLHPLNRQFSEHITINVDDNAYECNWDIFACFKAFGICLSYTVTIVIIIVCVKIYAI
jgi:hypothetical protein